MATSINFPTYGFINDTLALNEENWRKFFKPFIYDSVQSGLVTTKGTGMTVDISAGECRCGAVMGLLNNSITLDVSNGHSTYDRIDSVIVQYSYSDPSTLSVAIKQGTPSANPVAPEMSKVFSSLWQMEIAQILVPSGATSSSSLTITDKRVIYESIEDAIDDIVISSSTEPTSPMNEIWFQDEPDNEYTVPTNAEFTELEQDVTDLKNSTDDLKSQSEDLLSSLSKMTNIELTNLQIEGKYVRQTTYGNYSPGDLIPTGSEYSGVYTDLIPLDGVTYVKTHSAGIPGTAVIAFYRSNGSFISGVAGAGSNTGFQDYDSTIPTDAKFVRFSGFSTTLDVTTEFKCYIGCGTNDMLKTVLQAKTPITTDTDLNDITQTGFYILYNNRNYTNTPDSYSNSAAWLIVFNSTDSYFKVQLLFAYTTQRWWCRYYSTISSVGSWSGWTSYDILDKTLYGKKISIIGDSISSYNGYNPTGYAYYYPNGDVDNVNETWWKEVVDKSRMTLVSNASWSGSSVCDDDDTATNTAKIAYSDARIADLSSGDVTPEIIVVLIGTNDFHRGYLLGSLTETSEIPDGTTSIRTFKEAYACMLNKIRTVYPHTHVYCCTLIQRYDSGDETYPILNSSGNALSQFNQAIIDIAMWTGCNVIRLDRLFSLAELPDYTVDGYLHPNAAGMKIIGNKILCDILDNERKYIS